ncbi:DNA polymerase alpha accessory factor Mcl1 [Coemansia sp. RSA 2599]|nr:DNA polymerase alpha accessory factor Mcl1 [Coemansia sp. RSA 2599]
MNHSITDARYAHAEGYTAVAFSSTGRQLITGGSDALVRVFQAARNTRDQEAQTIEQHGDSVLTLLTSQNKLISGDEEGVVLSFDTTGGSATPQVSGTVLRTALPARDISISANERMVAVAADDDVVRLVSLLDMALLDSLEGHRTAVSSVSMSPDAGFLVAVGCDGTARVWDLRESPATCVQVIPRLAYECEPGVSMEQYKVRWSPDGRCFAVPASDHAIRLIERNLWGSTASLSGVHTKMVTCVAWSSNSRYLASVGLDGIVAVWDVRARKTIVTHRTNAALCQVAWNPRANMLAFTDGSGALRIWDDPVPLGQGYASAFEDVSEAAYAGPSDGIGDSAMADAADSAVVSELFAADNEAAADEDGFTSADEIVDAGDALDDFIVDDDGAGYAEQPAPRAALEVRAAAVRSFQPGATPWIGDRRYLAFNMVGSVVAIAQDEMHNSVEIEFFDKSMHRDIHFSDSFRYSLAALSEAGCLFATTTRELANDGSLRGISKPSDASEEEASVVAFRAFASWAASSDWTLALPTREHPRCIAVSSAGAAVVTSLGMLRLLTCGGVQCHVESVPGRVVTCSAHNDMLLLIYETHGELEYLLMAINGQSKFAAGACPVSPSSSIVWAGFSEEGHPAVCDSRGILRVLHRYWTPRDACWVPVLDTRRVSKSRGRREAYWPVALSARQLMVATCRGRSRYPSFPRPILDELDIDIPLLQPDSQPSQLESRLLAYAIFHEQQAAEAERTGQEYPGGRSSLVRDELEQDKLLLRLVQLACKADRSQRAIDLALMIHLEQSFDAAIKIAIHQKQSQLAERLMRLKESKFAADLEADDDDDDDDEVGGGDRGVSDDNAADDSEQDVDMESDDQRRAGKVHLKQRRRPAATYGKAGRRTSDDDGSSDGDQEQDDEKGGGNAGPAATVSADRASSAFSRPPRHPHKQQQQQQQGGSGDRELVARPVKPPTTSKPFNPFGVVSPSKSMEIKRSDSFFDAADAHSKSLSRDSSATGLAGNAGALSKRAGQLADSPEAGGPRKKLAKKSGTSATTAQSKLSAFAFRKDSQQKQALGDTDAKKSIGSNSSGDGVDGDNDNESAMMDL